MTEQDVKLLLLIFLSGPRNPEQISTYHTTNLLREQLAYWMPTDRGRHALTLTLEGEKEAKHIVWKATENFDC